MRRPVHPHTCDTALDMHQRRCHPVSLTVVSPSVCAKAAHITTKYTPLLLVHTFGDQSRAVGISLSSGRTTLLLTAFLLLQTYHFLRDTGSLQS